MKIIENFDPNFGEEGVVGGSTKSLPMVLMTPKTHIMMV